MADHATLEFDHYEVQSQLMRIGVEMQRQRGLAIGGMDPRDFVRWLRTIPGGIGHDAFQARLASKGAAGPHPPLPDEREAPDVATYRDPPEFAARRAYHAHIRRIVPPGSVRLRSGRPVAGWGLMSLGDCADHSEAVERLSQVPDGAGPYAAALAIGTQAYVSSGDATGRSALGVEFPISTRQMWCAQCGEFVDSFENDSDECICAPAHHVVAKYRDRPEDAPLDWVVENSIRAARRMV